MKGLKRARVEEPPQAAAPQPSLLEQLPPDFWTFAHAIGAFSIEEWARLALCGLSLPAGVPFDEDNVCMACGRTDQAMAYDEWLRSERYVTRCLCQACFGKLHGPMVSCTDWLPHIRLA